MVILTSSNKRINETFTFNTMEECKRFQYVFKDHLTGVTWKEPVESTFYKGTIEVNKYKSPEYYANANLSWGFNSLFIEGEKERIEKLEHDTVIGIMNMIKEG